MMETDLANVLMTAGQIIKLVHDWDEADWLAASATPGLFKRYRRHLEIIARLRRELFDKEQPKKEKGRGEKV